MRQSGEDADWLTDVPILCGRSQSGETTELSNARQSFEILSQEQITKLQYFAYV